MAKAPLGVGSIAQREAVSFGPDDSLGPGVRYRSMIMSTSLRLGPYEVSRVTVPRSTDNGLWAALVGTTVSRPVGLGFGIRPGTV
jgi:hypothetical protein